MERPTGPNLPSARSDQMNPSGSEDTQDRGSTRLRILTLAGRSRRGSVDDGGERLFELRPQKGVLLGKLQCLTEMLGIFVVTETGLVRRDFEQDSARRAEIDRPEVATVDDGGDTGSGVDQRIPHLELRRAIFDRERDVVDRAGSLPRLWRLRQHLDIDEVGAVAVPYRHSR